jgi:hypothetical protein
LNKYGDIEAINLVTSILSLLILGFEVYYNQIMSLGGEFSIIDRSKLGYELEKRKRTAHEKPNMNEEIETLKAE